MRQRKTADEWRLHVDYGHGWEEVHAEATKKAIKITRDEYRENAPQFRRKITGPHRVPI
jgi:hypothetical protein